MPATFLLKTEPHKYSYSDLERDGKAVWDGVRNHLAMRYLNEMQLGDEAFIYHSQEGREIVGIAKVTGTARPDPSDETGKFVCVDLAPVRALEKPITLAAIKAAGWKDFDLVRMSRLSCMQVPEPVRAWILAQEAAGS